MTLRNSTVLEAPRPRHTLLCRPKAQAQALKGGVAYNCAQSGQFLLDCPPTFLQKEIEGSLSTTDPVAVLVLRYTSLCSVVRWTGFPLVAALVNRH
jgi:hypothetical protein